jgi:HAMP domain-containing protein
VEEFMMLHILALLAAAFPAFFALRWVNRELGRVENSLRRVDRYVRRPAPVVAPLTFDVTLGFYRPAE